MVHRATRWRPATMFAPFHPRRFDYPRFLLALILGGAGAALFLRFELPLPWMIGPMLACTAAALLRLPVAAPPVVRPPMSAVLGVLLGAGFTSEMIGGLGAWIPTLLGLLAFLLLSGAVCVVYFRRVGGYDVPTAFFAGMPGGLVEMVILGEERGGDARRIALVHSIRILLTVSALPFLIPALGGGDLGARPVTGVPFSEAGATAVLLLFVTAVAGVFLGRLLRLPAPFLTGPMLASAVVHVADLTHFSPPREIVWAAQLVLGVTLGCRFVGTPLREMGRVLLLSLGSFAVLVALAVGFALVLAHLTALDPIAVTLAYAPGGLVETTVVALALQIDVAFVATHHIVRVVLVMAAAAPIFALLRRRRERGEQDVGDSP